MSSQKRVWTVVGSVLLLFGLLAPAVRIPAAWDVWSFPFDDLGGIVTKNLARFDPAVAVAVTLLAVLAAARALRGRFGRLLLIALAQAALLGMHLLHYGIRLDKATSEGEVRNDIHHALAGTAPGDGDDPLYLAARSIGLEWGWALVAVGLALLFAAATLPDDPVASSTTL